MEAKDIILTDLIGKKEHVFYIPLYQRKYTWEVKKQVKQFWEDICFFMEEKYSNDFFFGSIIVKKDNSINSKHVLVDGQQRITTTLLLIAALLHSCKVENDTEAAFLKKCLYSDEQKFKLERIQDQEIIRKILNREIDSLHDDERISNYYKVFNYFVDEINRKIIMDKEFISNFVNYALEKIKVAQINLNNNEDENTIFESINSKGKNLNASDLIKNYVTMKLEKNDDLLKKFENNFVQYFKDDEPEKALLDFYKHMLVIKSGKLYSSNGTSIYYGFKQLFKNLKDEELEIELKKFIIENLDDIKIHEYINTTSYKYYLYPLMDGNKNNFYALIHVIMKWNSKIENNKLLIKNQNNIDYTLKWLTSLVVGRTLVQFGRVESNRTYAELAHKLNQELINNSNNFLESFNHVVVNFLTEATANYRMPTKSEIFDIEAKRDLYSTLKNNLKYILISIEESLSNKKNDANDLSIEHIFPQKQDEWERLSSELGLEKIKTFEQMKEWLHTLGNLSIVNKNDNSTLSNKVFLEKQKILEEKSYLKINKMIYEYDKWTVTEIKERAQKILDYIDKIWFK